MFYLMSPLYTRIADSSREMAKLAMIQLGLYGFNAVYRCPFPVRFIGPADWTTLRGSRRAVSTH